MQRDYHDHPVMRMRADNKTEAHFDAARRNGRKLADWMYANHDQLLLELGTERVEWATAMLVFRKLRLLDARGKFPSRDTAFRTWKRVQERVNHDRRSTVVSNADEIAPGVRSLAFHPHNEQLEARPKLTFRPAQARNVSIVDHAKPVSILPTDAQAPNKDNSAAAEIQRVFDEIGSGRTPMPGRQ